MKILERENIDEQRWDALVKSTPNVTFFSYTWYLDATTENWCALVAEDYTCGIALPYTKKLGIEVLYTPIFVRYIEWLGSQENSKEAEQIIRKRFSNMHIATRQRLLGVGYETYVYQELNGVERKLGSQAQRMLKKAVKNELQIKTSNDYSRVLDVVQRELKGKISGLDEQSMRSLKKLFEAGANAGVLKAYEVNEEGGIVCFEDEHKTLYLKGTVTEFAKKQGGMYAALNHAIDCALSNGKVFDFGGSRAEGVQRFNHNLGGEDVQYFVYKVDKTPFWFKFARRIKNTWKK